MYKTLLRYGGLLLFVYVSPQLIAAQTANQTQMSGPATSTQTQTQTQTISLSPGAQEVAREIGVTALLERLYQLPEIDRGKGGTTMTLEALSLRQEITERIMSTSLDVDGVIAEIDNETANLNSIRADLESKRDHAQKINNIANIVTGGALGVVGTALQFKSSTANLGNGIGLGGGAASVVLSVLGIYQQRGGQRTLSNSPNMLARLFDRKPEFHSDYPDDVWTYLNAARPLDPVSGTRREKLIEQWKQGGRVGKVDTPKGQAKIDALTSSISKHPALSIDQIADREAMLDDVRAQISLIKRDLSRLVVALKSPAK